MTDPPRLSSPGMAAVLVVILALALGDYGNAQPYRQWRREPAPYDADDDPWNQPPDPNPQGDPEQTQPQGAYLQPPPPLLQHPEAPLPGVAVEYTQLPVPPFPQPTATGAPHQPQGPQGLPLQHQGAPQPGWGVWPEQLPFMVPSRR